MKQTNSLKVYKTVYRIWADGSVDKSTYCENKRTGAQIPSTTEKPGKAIMPVIPALGGRDEDPRRLMASPLAEVPSGAVKEPWLTK